MVFCEKWIVQQIMENKIMVCSATCWKKSLFMKMIEKMYVRQIVMRKKIFGSLRSPAVLNSVYGSHLTLKTEVI